LKEVSGRSGRLAGEGVETPIDFGDGLGELFAADGVPVHGRLAAELGAREAERLDLPLPRGVLHDRSAPGPLLLQFVEPILDSRLCVDQSFRAIPHTLPLVPSAPLADALAA
jgi:hypothetical protein